MAAGQGGAGGVGHNKPLRIIHTGYVGPGDRWKPADSDGRGPGRSNYEAKGRGRSGGGGRGGGRGDGDGGRSSRDAISATESHAAYFAYIPGRGKGWGRGKGR
jgi:hypothetical protein